MTQIKERGSRKERKEAKSAKKNTSLRLCFFAPLRELLNLRNLRIVI